MSERSAKKPWTIQRLRVPLGFVVGGLYLWLAKPNARLLAAGALVALAGVAMRAWAAGHIVKNNRLATTGPYAHTRNPLYVGSFLIGCGFALMAHPLLLLAVVAFWLLVYGPVMRREREHVRGLYPAEYDEWARHVPMFVPRPLPWRAGNRGEASRFDPKLYLYHREWRAGLAYVAVVGWLVARAHFGF